MRGCLKSIRKRVRVGGATGTFDAVLRWNYGERTPEEELWFGPGQRNTFSGLMYETHPLLRMVKKEPMPAPPEHSMPVVFGSGWRR